MAMSANTNTVKCIILINGRFLERPMTGVDRYAFEIVKSIDLLLSENHPLVSKYDWRIAISPKCRSIELKGISKYQINWFSGVRWEQISLPIFSYNKVLVNLCNSAPLLNQNQLVVIHDAATKRVPKTYGTLFKKWYRVLIPCLLRFSKSIVTTSEFSKSEIVCAWKTNRNIRRVSVGNNHFDSITADKSILINNRLDKKPYLLVVGSNAWHKNFKVVIEALGMIENSPFDVVIAGGVNRKIFSKANHLRAEWIKQVGYVSDSELKALYESAFCFVFPSLYEGYGLPPVEAMYLKCPVICSAAASMPEVCGDRVLYFDPYSACDLRDKIMMLVSNPKMVDELRVKGSQPIPGKDWRQAAIDLVLELDCMFKGSKKIT